MCLCCTYGGFFSEENPKKTSGVIAVCSSGLEKIGNSSKIRKMAGYMKHWKAENFLRSQPSQVHDK